MIFMSGLNNGNPTFDILISLVCCSFVALILVKDFELQKAFMVTLSSWQRVLDDENLLTEILLLLSAKTLVKLKPVCRSWNSIITSIPFTRIHTRLHPPDSEPTTVIFLRKPIDNTHFIYRFISLPCGPPLSSTLFEFQIPFQSPKLLKSCNGLLLFSGAHPRYCYCYCIYNPATRQFKIFPKFTTRPYGISYISLAFDPLRFQGFKVVCLVYDGFGKILSYSSSDEGEFWKEQEYATGPINQALDNGIYYKGGIHWICLSEDSLYFDVEKEEFSRFASPPIVIEERGFDKFCELNGKLQYANVDIKLLKCKVYALLGYEEGWILEYNFDASPSMGKVIHEWADRLRPWFVDCEEKRRCEERRLEVVFRSREKLMAYDLERKTWRTICEDRPELFEYDAFPYTPTLALF